MKIYQTLVFNGLCIYLLDNHGSYYCFSLRLYERTEVHRRNASPYKCSTNCVKIINWPGRPPVYEVNSSGEQSGSISSCILPIFLYLISVTVHAEKYTVSYDRQGQGQESVRKDIFSSHRKPVMFRQRATVFNHKIDETI